MEKNAGKIRIVEFNGTPGCGKTTIVKSLAERVDCGVKYDHYRSRISRNVYSMLMNPRYYSLSKRVCQYANLYPQKHELSRCLLPAFFLRKYRFFLEDDSVHLLLVDQGFVQSIISLVHTNKMIESELLDDIVEHSGLDELPILMVNCECEAEVSVERIKGRVNNGARVHAMSDDDMYQTIKNQINGFCCMRAVLKKTCPDVKTITINTSDDVDVNVNRILNLL